MGMRTVLNIPTRLPRWATNTGRTIEPGETDKNLGHVVGTRAVARWNNDLQKLNYEWEQVLASLVVSNFQRVEQSAITNQLFGGIYHPDLGLFCAANTVDTNCYYAVAGHYWELDVSGDYPAVVTPKSIAIDSNYFIVAGTNSDVYYNDDLTTGWATNAGPTALNTIQRITTKYPDGDFVMAVDSVGAVRKAASVSGTWSAPATTAPTYSGTGNCVALLYLGGTSWMIITEDAESRISHDDGDTWAATATEPDTLLTSNASAASFNPNSGTIVVSGSNGSVYTFVYSTDNGATWNQAAVTSPAGSVLPYAHDLQYCGGRLWLCGTHASSTAPYISASYDDGRTFLPVILNTGSNSDLEYAYHILCDGRHICIIGGDDTFYNSLGIPGSAS